MSKPSYSLAPGRVRRKSVYSFPDIAPTPLTGRDVVSVSYTGIPPHSRRSRFIFRQKQFEAALAIIVRLMPQPAPVTILDDDRLDAAPLPGVRAVPLSVEVRLIGSVVFLNFPLAADIDGTD